MFFDNILGEEQIKDYSQEYLSFRPTKQGCVFAYKKYGTGDDLQYSLDNGTSWQTLPPLNNDASETITKTTPNTIYVRFNDVILWRGRITPSKGNIKDCVYYRTDSKNNLYVTALGAQLNLLGDEHEYKIVNNTPTVTEIPTSGGSVRFISSSSYETSGNPASILTYKTNAPNDDHIDFRLLTKLKSDSYDYAYAFACMFMPYWRHPYGYSKLESCKNLFLGFEDLSDFCCAYMFAGCPDLYAAPELPSMNLAMGCYAFMFDGLKAKWGTSYINKFLHEAPSTLPATHLNERCYYGMFNECNQMTRLPIINATNGDIESCARMFTNVYTTGSADRHINVPIVELKKGCCAYMFVWGGLVPTLPAEILTDKCYHGMFAQSFGQWQTSVTLTVLAKEVDETTTWGNATRIWIGHQRENINNSVVKFIKNDDYEWTKTSTGINVGISAAIPSKWTVKNYSEVNS